MLTSLSDSESIRWYQHSDFDKGGVQDYNAPHLRRITRLHLAGAFPPLEHPIFQHQVLFLILNPRTPLVRRLGLLVGAGLCLDAPTCTCMACLCFPSQAISPQSAFGGSKSRSSGGGSGGGDGGGGSSSSSSSISYMGRGGIGPLRMDLKLTSQKFSDFAVVARGDMVV